MITLYDEFEQLNEEFNGTSLNENLNEDLIEECFQIGDTVKLQGEKGYVIGQVGDDLIIQIQGSTHRVGYNSKKIKGEKQESVQTEPHMKFDKITQKLLFEQYVRCGIFVGNTPVKVDNCYTRFSEFNDARDDQPVNVMIEGQSNFVTKNQIRIFEDVNDFANPDNYVPGFIVDEETEEPQEEVMIHALDYVKATGDASNVRVFRKDSKEPDSMPVAVLRTLSV